MSSLLNLNLGLPGARAIIRFDGIEKKSDALSTKTAEDAAQNLGENLLSKQFPLELASSRTHKHTAHGPGHQVHTQSEGRSKSSHSHKGRHSSEQVTTGGHQAATATDGKSHKKGELSIVAASAETLLAPLKRLPSIVGFAGAMNVYWKHITSARSHHQYFGAFPPVYAGMDAPHPTPPTVIPGPESIKSTGKLPSLNDLYAASKDLNRIVTHDKTQPDFHTLDLSEGDFKRRYAQESVNVGKDYNLNKATMANLVKRVYAFEDGGWGTYSTLSSMPQALMDDNQKDAKMKFHPLSSAIGYNQLLMKDTVNDIAQHGAGIATRLDTLAAENPARAQILHGKAVLVRELQDVLNHKTSPEIKIPADKHKRFSESSSKMEQAVQSLNLDGDIGPVIQSQELNNLLKFARDNKFGEYLNTKTTLETSHAGEYDKLTPEKKVAGVDQILALVRSADLDPTKPESITTFNGTKASLRNKFLELNPEGIGQSAVEREHLTADEFRMMNSQILTIRRYGGEGGPLTPEARACLDRVTFDYFGGFSADRLQAAAIELANLAGMGSANMMLQPGNSNLPTSNFFARPGYQGNPVTSRRSAGELLLQIYRIMHGPNSDPSKIGMKQFNDAFNSIVEKPEDFAKK